MYITLSNLVFAGDKSTYAVKVNGTAISMEEVNLDLAGILPSIGNPKQKDQVIKNFLDDIINQELVIQDAQKTQLSQQPAIKARVDGAKRSAEATVYLNSKKYPGVTVSGYDIDEFAKAHPEFLSGRRFFHFIQVLVDSNQTSTEDVSREYNEGGMTKLVAWVKSKDIGYSMFDGWLSTEQIPSAATREALMKLKDGETKIGNLADSKQIEVLRLIQSQSAPVSLEEARMNIGRVLTSRNLQDAQKSYLHSLRTKADIVINDALYAEKPETSVMSNTSKSYTTGIISGSVHATLLFLMIILVTRLFAFPESSLSNVNNKARGAIFVVTVFIMTPWFAWPLTKGLSNTGLAAMTQGIGQGALTGLLAAIVLALIYHRSRFIPNPLRNPWFILGILCASKLILDQIS